LLQNSAGTIVFDNLPLVAGTSIKFSLNPEFTVILGTSVADTSLVGTGGDNIIYGFGGNDTLNGGLGNDVLVGGLGGDAFAYNLSIDNGNDTILDYNFLDGDIIALQTAGGTTINDLSDVLDFTINAGGQYEASLLQNDLATSAGTIIFDNLTVGAGTKVKFSLNPEYTVVLGTNGIDILTGTLLGMTWVEIPLSITSQLIMVMTQSLITAS